jgi:hypothetical protein
MLILLEAIIQFRDLNFNVDLIKTRSYFAC